MRSLDIDFLELDLRGIDFSGAQHLARQGKHIMHQYTCALSMPQVMALACAACV